MVIHVRNNGGQDDPDAPGTTGWELIHDVAGHEAVVGKRTPNGFAGTELGTLLADAREVVIVGMQSEYCVRGTSLAALHRGNSCSDRGRTRTGRSPNPRRRGGHVLSDEATSPGRGQFAARARSSAAQPAGSQVGLPPGRPSLPLRPMLIRCRARSTAQPRARAMVAASTRA
jgi:Isochorismatase family